MTAAARASALTPVVHAIDDSGALCKAAPRPRWRPSTLLPVNCPRCLLAMQRERWALCGVPGPTGATTVHIRRVGPEGLRTGGAPVNQTTLCGQPVGWDIAEFEGPDLWEHGLHETCLRAFRSARRANAQR